jgi:hypothetical protein
VGDDVAIHRTALAAAAGEEGICVAGGARYTERELGEAMEDLRNVVDSRGEPLTTPGYGTNTIANRIDMFVDVLDPKTRQAVSDAVGDRVVLSAYIELIDRSLADLPDPVPVVEGNIDILTSSFRMAGGMDALGRFVVRYDSDSNCLFFEEEGGGRTVPVWPFGYTARNDPVAVYDYDGRFVVGEGETLEVGGGFVEAGFVEGNACGATGAWIVNR